VTGPQKQQRLIRKQPNGVVHRLVSVCDGCGGVDVVYMVERTIRRGHKPRVHREHASATQFPNTTALNVLLSRERAHDHLLSRERAHDHPLSERAHDPALSSAGFVALLLAFPSRQAGPPLAIAQARHQWRMMAKHVSVWLGSTT